MTAPFPSTCMAAPSVYDRSIMHKMVHTGLLHLLSARGRLVHVTLDRPFTGLDLRCMACGCITHSSGTPDEVTMYPYCNTARKKRHSQHCTGKQVETGLARRQHTTQMLQPSFATHWPLPQIC